MLNDAFVEHDLGRHGKAELARGQRLQARRIYAFGKAAYPRHVRRNSEGRSLGMLLKLGPLGQQIACTSANYYTRHSRK